jgi:hypothetical protein
MDLEGNFRVIKLTNEQQKQLLLLTETDWKKLRSDMKKHFAYGTDVTTFPFLLALTNEQWQTIDLKLTQLRSVNKETLRILRRETRQQLRKSKKTEYMRYYMQRYRQQNRGAPNGQVSNQGSG